RPPPRSTLFPYTTLFRSYLAYQFQRILRDAEETRHLSFRLQANVWLNDAGQITRVELLRSSGDADVDARVIAALRAVPALSERPDRKSTRLNSSHVKISY